MQLTMPRTLKRRARKRLTRPSVCNEKNPWPEPPADPPPGDPPPPISTLTGIIYRAPVGFSWLCLNTSGNSTFEQQLISNYPDTIPDSQPFDEHWPLNLFLPV